MTEIPDDIKDAAVDAMNEWNNDPHGRLGPAIARAILAERNRNKWLPIASAPRDGTKIDLWVVDQDGEGERIPNAWYVRGEKDWIKAYMADGTPFHRGYCERDGWFADHQDYDDQPGWCDSPRVFNPQQNREMFVEPTRWMPLPAPPETEREAME